MTHTKRRASPMPIALVRCRPDIHSERVARDFITTVWHECAHLLAAAACGEFVGCLCVAVGSDSVAGCVYTGGRTPLQDAFIDFAGVAYELEHLGDEFTSEENYRRFSGDGERALGACSRLGVDHEWVFTAAHEFVRDHIDVIRTVGRALIQHLIDADAVPSEIVSAEVSKHRRRIRPFREYESDWIRLSPEARVMNHWGDCRPSKTLRCKLEGCTHDCKQAPNSETLSAEYNKGERCD